jgi:GT2 family glycosyltransferase
MLRKRVAVVILNYNGATFLERFLPTLLQHTPEAQLIVADNASTDESQAVVGRFTGVDWLELDRNYGFAEGYNRALEKIDTPYSLLLNSDVEVSEGWLTPLLTFLDTHADYVACQPKILSWHAPTHFEYAGACGGYVDWLAYPFCRGRLFDTLEEDRGQYDTPQRVAWTSGACMLIRTEIFRKAGGFDPRFFAHMEEIDLCWRLERAGHKLAVIPQSKVFHVGGGTLAKTNPKKTFLNFRNGLLMLYRNTAPATRPLKLLLRLLLDWLAAASWLVSGEGAQARAVLQAHKAAFNMMRRGAYAGQGAYPRLQTHSRNLLIWEYFLRGKKRYMELAFSKDIKKVQL